MNTTASLSRNQQNIPRATLEKLRNPSPRGSGAHADLLAITYSLVGCGLPDSEIFALAREAFEPRITDREISDAIRGARGKVSPNAGTPFVPLHPKSLPPPLPKITKEGATAAALQFTAGRDFSEADFHDVSDPRLSTDPRDDAELLFRALFLDGEELVNVCPNYGRGMVNTRDGWIRCIERDGPIQGDAGCLFRFNPVQPEPTGDYGGFTDADVTACRFALVENDLIDPKLQLSVLALLPLPVVAILFTGGKSFHCLVRIDAEDRLQFKTLAVRMLIILRPFGFDQSTSNPSRMTRLPGAMRNGRMQKLFYLNVKASEGKAIFS